MKKYFETGLMVLCAAGFFGFIYPELCLTEDTVKIVESETGDDKDSMRVSDIYNDRYAFTKDQVRIRFRIKDIVTGNK